MCPSLIIEGKARKPTTRLEHLHLTGKGWARFEGVWLAANDLAYCDRF
jgi:hypothetical protein